MRVEVLASGFDISEVLRTYAESRVWLAVGRGREAPTIGAYGSKPSFASRNRPGTCTFKTRSEVRTEALMKVVTNERRIRRLRDVFKAPAPMTNRRSRARPADGNPNCERFWKEWLALRAWEDDGGRGVQTWPASADESRPYAQAVDVR
jgi:hypothetical protein